MPFRWLIGSLEALVFCPEGRPPAVQPVLAVGQPDAAVVEGAAVADAQPLALEPQVEVEVEAAPAAGVALASLLSVRVVRLEAEVASLVAATAQAGVWLAHAGRRRAVAAVIQPAAAEAQV
jgi:hypothetical protein